MLCRSVAEQKEEKMYIRKRLGKYNVEIKRQGHKAIYKSFQQKSDAMKWG